MRVSFPHSLRVETRTMCRCSPCPSSGWWCWRSASPTRPPTRSTRRRTETTLTPLSWSSLFQTLFHTPAPGSHHRWGSTMREKKNVVVFFIVLGEKSCLDLGFCWENLCDILIDCRWDAKRTRTARRSSVTWGTLWNETLRYGNKTVWIQFKLGRMWG